MYIYGLPMLYSSTMLSSSAQNHEKLKLDRMATPFGINYLVATRMVCVIRDIW
jgi:hypothetical protein